MVKKMVHYTFLKLLFATVAFILLLPTSQASQFLTERYNDALETEGHMELHEPSLPFLASDLSKSLFESFFDLAFFDMSKIRDMLSAGSELFGPTVDFNVDREAGVCLVDVDVTSVPKNSEVHLSVDESGWVEMTYESGSNAGRGFLSKEENEVSEYGFDDTSYGGGFITSVSSSRHFRLPDECDPTNNGAKATILDNQHLLRIRLDIRDEFKDTDKTVFDVENGEGEFISHKNEDENITETSEKDVEESLYKPAVSGKKIDSTLPPEAPPVSHNKRRKVTIPIVSYDEF